MEQIHMSNPANMSSGSGMTSGVKGSSSLSLIQWACRRWDRIRMERRILKGFFKVSNCFRR